MVATAHMLAETLQDCKTPTLYSRHLLIMEVILRIPTHMQADTRAPKIAEVLRQLQWSVSPIQAQRAYSQLHTWTDNAMSESRSKGETWLYWLIHFRYLKLGLMGVTIVFSSGDFGVGGYEDQCCYYNNCYGTWISLRDYHCCIPPPPAGYLSSLIIPISAKWWSPVLTFLLGGYMNPAGTGGGFNPQFPVTVRFIQNTFILPSPCCYASNQFNTMKLYTNSTI